MRLPASSSGTGPGRAGTTPLRISARAPENGGNKPFSCRDKHRDEPGQVPESPSEPAPIAPLEGARGGTAGQTLGGFCPSRLKTAEIRHSRPIPQKACPGLCPAFPFRSNDR